MSSQPVRAALIGASGMLGQMVREVAPDHYHWSDFDLPAFDLSLRGQVLSEIGRGGFDLIVNCAAYTDVDGCESNPELANRVNGDGPGLLAEAAKLSGATLVHISTDYVFDGLATRPYSETSATGPRSAYGRSKLLGEEEILGSRLEKFLIIRTSWLFGPGGKNFVETMLRLATEREELRVVDDQVGSPTYTADLAQAIFALLEKKAYGLFHFANAGVCSWYQFSREIVRKYVESGGEVALQRHLAITTADYPLPAARPAYSVFSTAKYQAATGKAIPSWQDALDRYLVRRRQLNRPAR
ncbi:dTDP-4-dehydrorhamnose reductase [Desulfuromonas carbonis]|uniref:dTDP-4-dehydrorhamnose reductase n=1 Tax=Desulfuromonas sp. DDH964 TaxID=1823759 RepID=UPI00078C7188|nr:dTDP-4-dehydrorhamnose reductase [Desulfuromonas sp. DDH964]AMV72649.1 dTDP-4-dehydrorhamnose reductase [Desulfuromonas sp. DDH964]